MASGSSCVTLPTIYRHWIFQKTFTRGHYNELKKRGGGGGGGEGGGDFRRGHISWTLQYCSANFDPDDMDSPPGFTSTSGGFCK